VTLESNHFLVIAAVGWDSVILLLLRPQIGRLYLLLTVGGYIRGQTEVLAEETCCTACQSTATVTWITVGLNPGLRGEHWASNCLICGTASVKLTVNLTVILEGVDTVQVRCHSYLRIYMYTERRLAITRT
jgi:hypothetical protein